MHVLILNQTFHPDTAATAQHMWDLAQDLDGRGHRVTVLTSRFYYGTTQSIGAAFERYGRAIEVHRVGGTRFGKKSRLGLLGRMSDFASFYVSAAWKLTQLERPDVILALTSPPMIAALAVARKWFDGVSRNTPLRVVYHVMDLYPDAAVASGMMREGGMLERLGCFVTCRTLAGCDAVIALGEDMRERMMRRFGRYVSWERIHVVPPWADDSELWPVAKRDNALADELGLAGKFCVVYSGNLGVAHDLETIAGAIELTREDQGLAWVFIGGGKRYEQLRQLVTERRWPHVHVLPYQPRERLNQSLNLADVHLVSQLPAFTGVVVPSKIFGIMAVGKPSAMVGPINCECARIIQRHEMGIVIANGDTAGLAAGIRRLRDDVGLRDRLGCNARRALEEHYSRRISCMRIESILQSVVTGGPAATR